MTRALLAIVLMIGSVSPPTHTSAQTLPRRVQPLVNTGHEWATGVATPASRRFVVYSEEHAIRIFNLQTKKSITVPVTVATAMGGSLSISSSGSRLIFPVEDDATHSTYIWAMDLDPATGAPRSEPHRVSVVPAIMATVSSDGSSIALVAIDNNVHNWAAGNRLMVMPSEGGNERVLDSANSIRTPRFTPDGRTIYYARKRALARIPTNGGAHDSIAAAARVIGVSPDGKYVAFVPEGLAIQRIARVIDTNGKIVSSFSFDNNNERMDAWLPGKTPGLIGFRSIQPSPLEVVSLSDGGKSAFQMTETYASAPQFSPAHDRLGIVAKINDVDQLVIYDMKSKQRRTISSPVQPERESWQWSPDGKKIAFLAVNPENQHYEIYVADVGTGRSTRLADTGTLVPTAATLYRWRDNGAAIDFITGTSVDGKSSAQVQRVTLAGAQSVVRSLPSAPQGNGTDGGYRLVSDNLVIIGTDKSLIAVPLPAGEPRTLAAHPAFWMTTIPRSLLSPDGRWIAFGSVGIKDGVKKPQWAIASVDGTEFRLLGAPMGCDAFPFEWLRDSRALIALGAPSCENFHWETNIVPIDGGPSRSVSVPINSGYTLTPDSQSLLVAAQGQAAGSIVTYDVSLDRR